MYRLIIFDDGRGKLGPMTDLRASFEVRTGMFTTAGRIASAFPKLLTGYWVPEHLAAVLRSRANAPVNQLPNEEILLCINGRWAMPDDALSLSVGQALIEYETGDVVAAVLRHADALYLLTHGELGERTRTVDSPQRVLYRYPWDVIALMKQTIPHDILSTRVLDAHLPREQGEVMGDHPVQLHTRSHIGPYVVFDATQGPIIVHEHAVVRPHAILCGPVSIGERSAVIDRALIKPHTVIGPGCKVGGEVGGTIFQGMSNKSHDGHLGDSWVGKWVNFGAGTTNSNLLNTYSEVLLRIDPDGPMHRTGLTFLGCIAGDHVKLAINSRIMTGSVFGTGSMIATTAAPPACVRRFAWLTDAGERRYGLDKFLGTMRTVMQRRDRTPSDAYLELVSNLHRRTEPQTRA